MPRPTNFDKLKLQRGRSVVSELKTELRKTKEVSDLLYPNPILLCAKKFFDKHEDVGQSGGSSETVNFFVTKSLQSQCHRPRTVSEDVGVKMELLKEKFSKSSSEVSLISTTT